ncbi:MAG: zinc ribbon domain-containing protein [Cytophagaceae bacterium]
MKYCVKCGSELNEDDRFCVACGAAQYKNSSGRRSGVILTICILTILGSGLGLVRGLLYQSVAGLADNPDYWRGYAFAIVNIGTIAGAIFMMAGKITGFRIYLIFQISYILLVILTTYIYKPTGDSDLGVFVGILGFFVGALFIVPSIILLIFFVAMAPKRLN